MFSIYKVLTKAIQNEIAIDREVFNRLNPHGFSFIPIRPIISVPYLRKIPFRKTVYLYINIIFLVGVLIIFAYQFFNILKLKLVKIKSDRHNSINKYDSIVLVANSRILDLYNEVNKDSYNRSYFINFNQDHLDDFDSHIYQHINFIQICKCYIIALTFILIKIKMLFRINLLQLYVCFDWLVKYEALKSITFSTSQDIYFSNHYDRWAVMFDSLLAKNNLILIQHGLLPNRLNLPYKLTNLKKIYTLNANSQHQFKNLFKLGNESIFGQIETKLQLSDTPYQKSVLVIGQPHSAPYEVEIIKELLNINSIDRIWVKPHPLYSKQVYKSLKSPKVQIIHDKAFFPNVTVALNYESTLGIEYENLGIPVIGVKSQSIPEIALKVEKMMIT